MGILIGLPVFALLAVALLVGGRLLLLARRTRRAPEFCMGMGFYPNAVSGIRRWPDRAGAVRGSPR